MKKSMVVLGALAFLVGTMVPGFAQTGMEPTNTLGHCYKAPEPVVPAPVVEQPAAKAPAPVVVAPAPAAPSRVVVVEAPVPTWDIVFAFGAVEPMAKCKEKLDQIGKYMKDNPNAKLTIEGHADIRSLVGQSLNDRLSADRALAVVRELNKRGVDTATRFTSVAAFGSTRPILACPNKQPGKTTKDEEDRCQKNRRVEVRLK